MCKVRTSNVSSKEKCGPDTSFVLFPSTDLESVEISLGQNYDIPSGDMQSICEVRTFNVSPYERYGPSTTIALFSTSDLEPAKLTFEQNQDTPSGDTQSLCEFLPFLQRYRSDTNHAVYLSVTLNLPK